jgi:uncharacterized protein
VIWLSALVGGGLFGFGMVLASGCGSKTLVRIGGGSLKSLVVFFVMGVAAFATLRGITAVLRTSTVDQVAFEMAGTSALPGWLAGLWGWDASAAGVWVGGAVGVGLILWALQVRVFARRPTTGWRDWALGLRGGFVVGHRPAGFCRRTPGNPGGGVSGHQFWPHGVADLHSPHGLHARLADLLQRRLQGADPGGRLGGGRGGGRLGVCHGQRTFRWEGFRSTQDTALHIVGALCMGVGGVTAMGCTVGQGLSGLSTLSVTSVIAVVRDRPGVWAGFRFQMWLLERE